MIETQNILTNAPEPRVVRDFLEWRRELRTVEDLGAYRADTRNLIVGSAAPEPIQMAELTAAAFRTARVPPLLGRALLDSDETPGAPSVVVLGYDVWQRSLGGRQDVVGSVVKLGNTPATVIGVMPDGFAYPVNHDAWTPLSLRASYGALEGGAISVIGRLAPGVTLEQANAELRVFGERAAAALPATHEHLRPRVMRLGEGLSLGHRAARDEEPAGAAGAADCVHERRHAGLREDGDTGGGNRRAFRARRGPRAHHRSTVRRGPGARVGRGRGRPARRRPGGDVGDRKLRQGRAPFWMTPGLKLTTILYAGGLAVVSAAMLSLLPALKVTRSRVQPHLANLGTGGATLRFGRVWTGVMIVQVALTAIGIPVAMETASQVMLKLNIRAAFPSREYLAARIDLDRPFEEEARAAFEARRAQTFAALERRIAEEPGVVAVTFADRAPGSAWRGHDSQRSRRSPGAGPAFDNGVGTSAVAPEFFEAFGRPIVAGRAFHEGDRSPAARTVIVNEAFVRSFRTMREAGRRSALASGIPSTSLGAGPVICATRRVSRPWFEIVGVVRDVGLDPDDSGDELPFVFHVASAESVSPLVISVRMRGNPAPLAARLPVIAAGVDARLFVRDAQPLDAWVRQRDDGLTMQAGALAAVTLLVLFLSALGIFSLVSVSVSRRTREIGLRAALGADPRQLLAGILSRAVVLMGSGITAGGALLLWSVALGQGPSGRPGEDLVLFAGYLGATSAVMLAASLLACIGPARRALRINPADALREA